MSLAQYFPVFEKLSQADQQALLQTAVLRRVAPGTLVHRGSDDCLGLLIVRSGQLRAYITSEEGREITLYRLFEQDICLFTASCIMSSIQFEIMIATEKETEFWIIPPLFYKQLKDHNAAVANYTNEVMSSRFTDVMWVMEQVMWKSFDKRLAQFLMEESRLEGTLQLKITHEKIAAHLGSAREVVTRMLKYFQTEGAVLLTRGTIEITDRTRLEELA